MEAILGSGKKVRFYALISPNTLQGQGDLIDNPAPVIPNARNESSAALQGSGI